jgi:hypothetical protein
MSGKGSHPRPIPDRARYESEWDRIFGAKSSQAAQTPEPAEQEALPTPTGQAGTPNAGNQ